MWSEILNTLLQEKEKHVFALKHDLISIDWVGLAKIHLEVERCILIHTARDWTCKFSRTSTTTWQWIQGLLLLVVGKHTKKYWPKVPMSLYTHVYIHILNNFLKMCQNHESKSTWMFNRMYYTSLDYNYELTQQHLRYPISSE